MRTIYQGLLVVVAVLSFSAGAAETLPSERALVLVTELAHAVPEDRKQFYRLIETFASQQAGQYAERNYGTYVEIPGERATLQGVVDTLADLAHHSDIRAIDVLLEVHGGPGELFFRDGGKTGDAVTKAFAGKPELKKKLRALYSGACYGASHVATWLAAGFRVASGARKVNTNGMYDFPAFLKSWTAGESFATAQEKGNAPYWLKYFDDLAEKKFGIGKGEADSFKVVEGASAVTIQTPPDSVGVPTRQVPGGKSEP